MEKDLNIVWEKCHHGIEKRDRCEECEKEKIGSLNYLSQLLRKKDDAPVRIPIRRGCQNTNGCFCDGRCNDIIGYRDPIFPGEKP